MKLDQVGFRNKLINSNCLIKEETRHEGLQIFETRNCPKEGINKEQK